MNIAVDIAPLKSGHFLQHRVRGTGFYLENLKKSLLKYFPHNSYTFFDNANSLPGNIDVVHIPYFEPFFLTLPFKKHCKTIVTVHDLTPLVFSKEFPGGIKGNIKWQVQKFFLKRMDAIIADSNCSKNDIGKFAGISKDKIHTVYLAAGEEFEIIKSEKLKVQNLRKKYNLPEKFLLYVGDATWNKNLPRIVKASIEADVPLVMVGKALTSKNIDVHNSWNKDLLEAQRIAKQSDNIFSLGFVQQEDLVLLYNTATAFIMPSLYEGFGLPILEAMSCGCPVITAKEGSIPEIAGDAALYVDAYSVDDIVKGIKKVLSDEKLRQLLSQKGIKQAKKFSWEKTAQQTLEIYKSVI